MNYILLAIPFFLLLILLELLAEKIRGTNYYRINDAISSLSAGVVSRATGVIKQLVPLSIYALCYEHVALFDMPINVWCWLLAFVAYDFFYYWHHRMGHEINLLWAAHVVHHSSEEYNLTTALRQTSGGFLGWIFYLPLAILGVPAQMLFSIAAFNLIYQFWVHTRHIPKLGILEWFLVTPSNHRVHHAQNQVYIDRNYGGVFIIWDRLFGTFQQELAQEKPIYGIRKALHSWDPVWANVQVYTQLMKDCWRTRNWIDKILLWFKPTGWRPADMQQRYPLARVDLQQFQKYEVALTAGHKYYALFQHILILAITLVFLLELDNYGLSQRLLICALIIFSCYSVAAVLERRSLAVYLEWLKHSVLISGLVFLPFSIVMVSLACMSIVSLICWMKINGRQELIDSDSLSS